LNASPLAVSVAEQAGVLPQRYVSLRLFNGHIHRLALLALIEAATVGLAVYFAILVRFHGFTATFAAFEATAGQIWPRALLVAGIFLLSLAALGLYELHHRAGFNGVLVRLALAIMLAEVALALIFYVAPQLFVGRGVTFLIGGFAFIGLALTRFVFLRLVDEEFFKRRVLVWGAGARATSIGKRLRRRSDQRGFRIVGYLRAPGDSEDGPAGNTVRAPGELVRHTLQQRVEEIVVAMDDQRAGFPAAELLECRLRGIYVTDLVTFLERESGRVSVEVMRPSWLIFSNGFRCDVLRLTTKRIFDVMVSLGILLVTLPVSLLTMLAIKLEDGGPVFYRQIRTGQNGRLFPILKFRSMRVDAEKDGQPVWASANDARVTRVGGVLRRLRIDELPQVLNVLVGHMSFVGPRPERPAFVEELARELPYYRERHFVKPGITGWAQVRYSYGSSHKDAQHKLEYDLYYVKHHSFAFDLMVLLQTVEIVLFRIGAR
jgi:sugar transferase (PEP-CTERM system associated)